MAAFKANEVGLSYSRFGHFSKRLIALKTLSHFMRVLHIAPASPFGGVQRLAIDLVAQQRVKGLESSLLLLNSDEIALQVARSASVPIVGATEPVRSTLRSLQIVRRQIARGRYDVVHLHLPPPWFPVVLRKRRPFALVTHLHVRPTLQVHAVTPRRRLESMLGAVTLARSDMLLSISKWVESAWRQAHPWMTTPARVVYNGVDIAAEEVRRGLQGDHVIIGMASRLSDRKGLDEFLLVARRIYELMPHVRFKLAGDGPMRLRLERKVKELGLDHVMSFVGFKPNIAEFWKTIDIALFTAPFEPFGLRLIEPIAHGVPVVAYYNGSGSDEVICACRGIRAVAYGDIDAIAGVVIELGRSAEYRAEMAAVAREDVARHFSLDAMERKVQAAYHEVLDRRGGIGRNRAA